MFSALRKLTGRGVEGSATTTSPPGMQAMAASLQRRFARGIQYNSKHETYTVFGGQQCIELRQQLILPILNL